MDRTPLRSPSTNSRAIPASAGSGGRSGSAFPDFYHTTFHAPWYLLEHWSRWFDVVAYLPQSSLEFQDQIVLRRRDDLAGGDAPIRARYIDEAPPAASTPSEPFGDVNILKIPAPASRFGQFGLLARQGLFRVARPILHAQQRVNRSQAIAISSLEARLDDRMPPLVEVALRKQAERIERLERDIRGRRRASDDRGSADA
jgi:hypothetical protein